MSRTKTVGIPTDLSHLSTGFTKVKVVAINPDKELYEQLNEEELDVEPKYHWEKDGVRKAVVDIYMKDVANRVFRHRIILTDKNESSQTGKVKFVNQVGEDQWANKEDDLWTNIKQFEKVTWKDKKIVNKEVLGPKKVHIAKIGEVELLKYRMAVLKLSPYDIDSNVFLDLDPLFDGDFSELQSDIGGEEFHFVILTYVDEDFRQKVWKQFLPNNMLAEINSGQFSSYSASTWNKFKENLENEYSGIKGHYYLGRIKVFDESDIKLKRILSEDGPDY